MAYPDILVDTMVEVNGNTIIRQWSHTAIPFQCSMPCPLRALEHTYMNLLLGMHNRDKLLNFGEIFDLRLPGKLIKAGQSVGRSNPSMTLLIIVAVGLQIFWSISIGTSI